MGVRRRGSTGRYGFERGFKTASVIPGDEHGVLIARALEPFPFIERSTDHLVCSSCSTFRTRFLGSRSAWPNGEQVYVSQATGEVVQYTTTASRIGAYLGPIPHWFYFTPLRKHGPEWSRVVIWSSGIGTISAILGVVIGIWMYSPSRKYRYAGAPTSIPYRGQKRWHTVFGLIFGIATVTYAFSGMLSMDTFPSFNDRV